MTNFARSLSRSVEWTWFLHCLLFLAGSTAIVAAVIVGEVRVAVAGVVVAILLGLAQRDVRLAILGILVYLTFLGDLRRLLVPIAGWSGNDPLLLVTPAITCLLFAGAILTKRITLDTPVAKATALFMGFMTLQIFNPRQGGLMVGVAGAMLYLVPMLWFWVGRAFATKSLIRTWLFKIMPVLALCAALMGLYQVFYGWLPYQLEWFRIAGYSALGPNEDMLRSISIFPNLSEYIQYLGIVIVAACAAAFKKRGDFMILAIILFTAIFLAGSRGPVVKILLAVSILYTVQGKSIATWAPRLAFTLLIGGGMLVWGLTQAGEVATQSAAGNERVGFVLERQSKLLPSGGEGGGGTVGIHGNLFWIGIKQGFEQPLGLGIGSTTLAGAKYGTTGAGTEKDLTDMFVAGGIVGGVLYLALVVLVSVSAVRYWQRQQSLLALSFVGILAFMGLSWLKPGAYVLTPVMWLIIGSLDRFVSIENAQDAEVDHKHLRSSLQ